MVVRRSGERSSSVSRPSDRDEREASRVGEAISGVRPPWVQDGAPGPVPAGVFAALDRAERGGEPLRPADRSAFAPHLGGEIDNVRVHADGEAAALAGRLHASAFTRGSHVYLGSGWTTATGPARRALLGHELGHAVSQLHDPTPARILRSPGPGEVVTRVDIYLGSGAVIVRTSTGGTYRLVLDREGLNLVAREAPYRSTHRAGQTPDDIASETPQNWRFAQPESGGFDLVNSPAATYDLYVHPELKTEATGSAGTGEKKGEGAGKEGTGKGPDPKRDAFDSKLKHAGVKGSGESGPKLEKLLADLDPADIADFVEYLKNAASGAEGVDFETLAEQYGKLSRSERELLKLNRLLRRGEELTAGALPEEVKIALTGGAQTTADISQQVSTLNDDLAKIRAKVTPDSLAGQDPTALDPIELAKLPAFNEMMMLQGLLAGASQRSPQVEAASKELVGTIGEIRSYVLEEIAWMTAEMAVGWIISALLAPASGGTSLALAGTRAAALLYRLNRLRKFLQAVEKVYSTYQYVETIVVNVTQLMNGYAAFRAQYDKWMAEWEALESKLDAQDLDEALEATLTQQFEDLEDRLVEEVQRQLDAGTTGLGSLLETFAIPAGTSNDELRQILIDLPRGVAALEELASYYRSGLTGDIEYTRTLAFKATAAGFLLFPFVGFLAMHVSNQLGAIMVEKDIGDRLFDILGRARGKSKRRLPKRKESRDQLRKVRTHRERKAAEKAEEDKKAKKGEDPKRKKKKDGEPPEDDKAKTKLGDDEWAKVKAKVAALPAHFGDDGATKDELLARGRAIRKAHPTVAKAPKVGDVPNHGDWRLTIDRKGLSPATAEAHVRMSVRTRWGKGVAAVERALAGITPAEVTPSGVKARLSGIQERFSYASLTTQPRRDRDRQGVAVRGRMGGQAERDVTLLDDVRGLHRGTKADPIPIHFYKEIGNYRKRIKLRVGTAMKDFQMIGNDSIDWPRAAKVEKVRVGVKDSNVVREGTVLRRGSKHGRTGTQANYRKALESAAFDWEPRGQFLDADHVLDIGFGGEDEYSNLWPLDARVNRHAYSGRWYMDYGIVYFDPKNPLETQESSLYRLVGKHFKVIGFQTTPKRPGGRDPVKP